MAASGFFFGKEFEDLIHQIKSDKINFLALQGPLGAGKTTFVQELASQLGADSSEFKSPTFLKVMEHKINGFGKLLHLDLYRIEDVGDIGKLDLEAYENIRFWCVEWPDLLLEFFRQNPAYKKALGIGKIVELSISIDGHGRRVWSTRSIEF